MDIKKKDFKNILIRSTNWIGDAIMTTPAVRAIRENFPDAHISILAKPWVSPVFENSEYIDRVIIYDNLKKHRGASGKLRLAKELRKYDFDAAILLQNAFEAALITFLASIKFRLGYDTDARGLLLTHPVKLTPEIKKQHQIQYYLDILRGLGLKADNPNPYLNIAKKDLKYADDFVKKIKGDIVIGINPGASYGPAKCWPAKRYALLSDILSDKYNAKVIIFGGKGDNKTGKSILEMTKCDPINLCGETSLGQAMALIKRCFVFVTNDSGLMHVAYAVNTPLVAIFGSTNPYTTGPVGPKSIVVTNSLDCGPCLKTVCPKKHFECMQSIDVKMVFKEAVKLIESCK